MITHEWESAMHQFLADACDHYEKTAPTVHAFCDDLYIRMNENPQSVTLFELRKVSYLRDSEQWMQPNFAANFIYHLMNLQREMGRKPIEYGKSEHGFEFPIYDGKLLSWTLSGDWEDEQAGFPKMRTVIRAMMERRPGQLARERYEMLRGSFDKVFGRNAAKVLAVIDEEIQAVTHGR